ncbi:MAG: radical SAM protein [Candidatus Auribacterota bacterium]|nr:radical SAM protein [Candidatus Auribacterota bacterium]
MDFYVHEIFKSIQGESSYAGFLCTFVRFAGCNLKCAYCDTVETQNSDIALSMSMEEILQSVNRLSCHLVLLTGGEPLLQNHIIPLCNELQRLNYTILIETNGTMGIEDFSDNIRFIMDVKCPGSAMAGSFAEKNLSFIKPVDELKFVISDRDDYLWAKQYLIQHNLTNRCGLIFSPVWGKIPLSDIAEWIIEDNLSHVRLQVQLHKLIWGPEAKGV